VAQPLTGAIRDPGEARSPILLLEQAVHLLRQAPAGVWACHFAGSAPFALALLFYWNSVTNPRTSSATTAAASLGMALLLVWMNCCRASFAIRHPTGNILVSLDTDVGLDLFETFSIPFRAPKKTSCAHRLILRLKPD